MKRLALGLLFAAAACGSSASPTTPELPWVQGFTARAATDALSPSADEGVGVMQVTGDAGETVAASYAGGVIVRDRTGVVVARASGFAETGSSDDLVALALGDGGLGSPVIAVAINRGGHRTSTTSLALYRVGDRGRLERIFFEPIQERDGDQTIAGSIALLPGSMLYRAPGAATAAVWTFDRVRGRYVPGAGR